MPHETPSPKITIQDKTRPSKRMAVKKFLLSDLDSSYDKWFLW